MNLPELSKEEFSRKLCDAAGFDLPASTVAALFDHYQELRRWAPKVDLSGPGAIPELFERHYAEALAALPWLPSGGFRLLDVGSGAGFPGSCWLPSVRTPRSGWWSRGSGAPGLLARAVEHPERRAAQGAGGVEGGGLLGPLPVRPAQHQQAREAVAMEPKKMRGGLRCCPPRSMPRHYHVTRLTLAFGLPALATRTDRAESIPDVGVCNVTGANQEWRRAMRRYGLRE